jgi:hypothetical protein
MVRKIDKETGEIRNIPVGGLYAPLPIPAIKILADFKEHNALRVLTCLVSFLGDKGWVVYPSYDTIASSTGLSRTSIKPALDVLEDYGFIKVIRLQLGRTKKQNKYYIQECSFKVSLMEKHVRNKVAKTARCLACIKEISRGEYAIGPKGGIHLGCGGFVIPLQIDSK